MGEDKRGQAAEAKEGEKMREITSLGHSNSRGLSDLQGQWSRPGVLHFPNAVTLGYTSLWVMAPTI